MLSIALPVSASDTTDYVLDENGKKIYIPLSYLAKTVFSPSGKGPLNNPQDFCLGAAGSEYEDHLFIADTENNRILIVTPNSDVVREITESDGKTFLRPSGITVNSGYMFISDTGNSRIVQLKMDGTYVKSFGKPESNILEKDTAFDVSRIALSDNGLFYVMRGTNFMMIDDQNRFQGYVGSTRVPYSLSFVLMRIFASQEQLEYYVSPEPPAYTSFSLGSDGLIYATIEGGSDQIQIINGNGSNVYVKGYYGEQGIGTDGRIVNPSFNDITVSEDGIITALEKNSGHLYQYNRQGELLTVFGGRGETKGFFTAPVAVAAAKGNRIYVMDSSRGDITLFEPTSFIKTVVEASRSYEAGNYREAYEKWLKIYEVNAGYPLANHGIALALYKNGEVKESLKYYRLAKNKAGYSDSFDDLRYIFFRENFFSLAGAVIAAFIGLYFLMRQLSRMSNKYLKEYFYGKEDDNK